MRVQPAWEHLARLQAPSRPVKSSPPGPRPGQPDITRRPPAPDCPGLTRSPGPAGGQGGACPLPPLASRAVSPSFPLGSPLTPTQSGVLRGTPEACLPYSAVFSSQRPFGGDAESAEIADQSSNRPAPRSTRADTGFHGGPRSVNTGQTTSVGATSPHCGATGHGTAFRVAPRSQVLCQGVASGICLTKEAKSNGKVSHYSVLL